jgi:hypothetical protein
MKRKRSQTPEKGPDVNKMDAIGFDLLILRGTDIWADFQ